MLVLLGDLETRGSRRLLSPGERSVFFQPLSQPLGLCFGRSYISSWTSHQPYEQVCPCRDHGFSQLSSHYLLGG